MWDQNPLLHKLTIDDLARDYQTMPDRPKRTGMAGRLSGVVTTLTGGQTTSGNHAAPYGDHAVPAPGRPAFSPVTRRRIAGDRPRSTSLQRPNANRRVFNMFKGLALSLTLIIVGMIGAPMLIISLV